MTPEQAFCLGVAFSKLTKHVHDGRDLGRIVDQRYQVADGWPEFSWLPDDIQGHHWNQYSDPGEALSVLRRKIAECLS